MKKAQGLLLAADLRDSNLMCLFIMATELR